MLFAHQELSRLEPGVQEKGYGQGGSQLAGRP